MSRNLILDAGEFLSTGSLVEADRSLLNAPFTQLLDVVPQNADRRRDAAGGTLVGVDNLRENWNANVLQQAISQFLLASPRDAGGHHALGLARRLDSFGGTGGAYLARQLEAILPEIFREPRPPKTGLQLFDLDTTVSASKESITARRLYHHGKAAIYRKGMKIPRVGFTQDEQSWKTHWLVCGYLYHLFEAIVSGGTDTPIDREMVQTCIEAIEDLWNHLIWHGNDASKIYGVLNYPWRQELWLSTPFTTANRSGTGPADKLNVLNRVVRWARDVSKSALSFNAMAMSPRIMADCAESYFTGDSGGAENVLDRFKRTQSHFGDAGVSAINEAPELQDAGGAGWDAMVLYRRGGSRSLKVPVLQGITSSPLVQSEFEFKASMYAKIGSIRILDVGAFLIVFVQVDTDMVGL